MRGDEFGRAGKVNSEREPRWLGGDGGPVRCNRYDPESGYEGVVAL